MNKKIAIGVALATSAIVLLFAIPEAKKWAAATKAYDEAHPDVCLQNSTVTSIQPVANWQGTITDYVVTFADGSVREAEQMVIPGNLMRGAWPPTLHIGMEYCTSWSNGHVPN